ncbi:MAG: PA2169 family four-helix-bundle protein [Burkholderiaceae bacterium]
MASTTTPIKHPSAAISRAAVAPLRSVSTAPAVVEILNNLVQTCADGAYGFAACADYSNISRHRTLFRQRAQDCDAAGAQLHAMMLGLGGGPARGRANGSVAHRGWVAGRGTLSGLRDQSLLAECERGETVTLERYRHALSQDLPNEVRTLVQRQCSAVERNLDQMHSLRESEKAAA